jgi:hypothetical protein
MQWFLDQLAELATESGQPGAQPALLEVIRRLRAGQLSAEDFQRYRQVTIQFLQEQVSVADQEILETFFRFLMQAEILPASVEVRRALSTCVQQRLSGRFDRTFQNAATALLRAGQPVTPALVGAIYEKAKTAHAEMPSWEKVSILASCVGRVRGVQYGIGELADDLLPLASHAGFTRALRQRDPVWRSMALPTDSIALERVVRARQLDQRYKYPGLRETFTFAVEAVNDQIVVN